MSIIQKGSTGAQVRADRDRLIAHGHNLKPGDVFDADMDRAVRTFQRARKLEADGQIGPLTRKALLRDPIAKPKPRPQPKPVTTPGYILFGTTPMPQGRLVRLLQNALYRRGYQLERDGAGGAETFGQLKQCRYELGYPSADVARPVVDARDWGYIVQGKPTTKAMQKLAAARKQKLEAQVVNKLKVLAFALKMADKGLVEQPADSNYVPFLAALGQQLGVQTLFWKMCYYWCAYFVMLCMLACGSKTARKGLVNWAFNPLSVRAIFEAADKGEHGLKRVSRAMVQPGDLVAIHVGRDPWGHIEIVRKIVGNTVYTVGGNTSSGSSGSQDNGGGVYRRERSIGICTAFASYQ